MLLKLAALSIASAALLSACGGGGGGGGASSAPASTSGAAVFVGPISGFGSVIVNGTRFSSVGAKVTDDDGISVSLNQLHIGTTVRVKGTVDDVSEQGTATELEIVHGHRGAVTAINTGLGTLTVLGQIVHTNSTTAYQGVASLAALTVGQTVEIYGSQQADGTLLATLVEVKTLTALSLIGRISNLNTATNRFDVGTLTVNFNPSTVVGTLVEGGRVKVKAAAGGLSGSVLTATSVRVLGAGWAWGAASSSELRIKARGVVDAAPVDGVLILSGTPVNVSKAKIEGGSTIPAGSFIEVKGIWDGSVLQATKVELEGEREARIGGRNELYGVVTTVSGTTASVSGVTVNLSAAVFKHGTLSQVVVGSYVEIKGDLIGGVLLATKVELKNGGEASGVKFEQFGPVTDFVSLSNFKLNGMVIDASQAEVEGAAASTIANLTYLEVKGTVNGSGVLVASKVEIK